MHTSSKVMFSLDIIVMIMIAMAFVVATVEGNWLWSFASFGGFMWLVSNFINDWFADFDDDA